MTVEPNNESIMVCVHYGPHGQRLIQRGSRLSLLLGAPLTVLNVDSSRDFEYNADRERYLSAWEKLTKEAGGEFLIRKCLGRRTADVIAETARERGITQIVIGQSGRTLWEEITQGSFINDLIEQLGPIDLHIVAVQRYPDMLEETHEKGITAFLVKQGESYVLSEQEEGSETIKGIFFRELHTDFNNGLFKTVANGEPQYLRIIQGEWIKPH
ncbi:universal stress protein [Paenibacillus sabinae]|uniref:UspA domain-containing protein n=1 Tax=Paenibacillus sabinae T27 TaxID=1268072 RepID=X4ZI11_9BACL|nr:universal stress protein [Paenibacillus sabinae]AHV99146.1 UspA domain-containing protein [Paenibacillus sabinae T27]